MITRSRYLLLLLALVLVVGAAGCNSADGSGAQVVTADSGAEGTGGDGSAAEPAKAGTRENPLPVGQTAKVGDWEVTVTSVNTQANEVIAQANMFNEPPAAGSQFVLISLKAKYVGEESGTFWVDMTTKFYGAAGNTFDQGGSTMAVAPDSITDAGETFPGAEIAGNVVFEVPADQIAGGALIAEESLSFDDTRVFFAIQ